MKDKWWCDRTRELQSAADTKNAKQIFSRLKTVYGTSSKGCSPPFDVDGNTVIKETILITERWAQQFDQLLNRQSLISEDAIAEVTQRSAMKELNMPPTLDETITAIKQMFMCDNHRGISLLTNAGKIFARVIVNRPTTRLESTFPESQCGFRSGRGTTNMLFAARQVQEKCREQNLDLCMVFADVTKPFDSVSREGLWKL